MQLVQMRGRGGVLRLRGRWRSSPSHVSPFPLAFPSEMQGASRTRNGDIPQDKVQLVLTAKDVDTSSKAPVGTLSLNEDLMRTLEYTKVGEKTSFS